MTTTTSTTSSTSTTASTGSTILTALGAGSGIDTASLVTNLASAAFSNKETALSNKETANTTKISALGTLTSDMSSLNTALKTLISGGTLKTQPSSSNSAIVTATASGSASISKLSAQIEVKQIAQAQSMASPALSSAASTVGTGSLTLTTASGTFNVAVDSNSNTLAGLASAINALNTGSTPSGVTASVVTDSNGARLVLKGATGSANKFSLTANSDADADLAQFASEGTGAQMTVSQAAQDAIVRMDGVDSTYSSNSVSSLIDGVTLNLVSAQPGTTVSIGVTRPTDALSQAVSDFVSAYNELRTEINTVTAAGTGSTDAGALYGQSAITDMKSQLSKITSTALQTGAGGPQTLAEIGVKTNQDGTLTLDSTKLSTALSTYPDAVEAMFNPTQYSSSSLVKITSGQSGVKAGTYTLANLTAGPPASGKIDGYAGLPLSSTSNSLTASVQSKAYGLTVQVLGNVTNATITIDPGLGGLLQSISDGLTSSGGTLKALSDSFDTEKTTLATSRTKLESDESSYTDRLTSQFTTMQTRVASYKSIQSYMTQQIAAWSSSS